MGLAKKGDSSCQLVQEFYGFLASRVPPIHPVFPDISGDFPSSTTFWGEVAVISPEPLLLGNLL